MLNDSLTDPLAVVSMKQWTWDDTQFLKEI